jgi:hypothetical protein
MSFADVVGSGRGTLWGKRESWNAILEGIEDILQARVRDSEMNERATRFSRMPFFLMNFLEAVPMLLRVLVGVEAKGGGFLDLAASQSKGVDEEMEGVEEGEELAASIERRGFGVTGRDWGSLWEDGEELLDAA